MPNGDTDESNPAIHLIYAEAAGKTVRDREAFLEEACAGDAEMRARLDAMLADCERDEEDERGAVEPDLPGKIGGYEVIRTLGRGGMGEVYLARDPELDREVAIKRLHFGQRPHPDAIARFQREMKAVARLLHPNVVTAFHAGEDADNGGRHLVMEYVSGSDLATHVTENGPVPREQAAEWILQAARGLQHAHEAGIVHRDVKPANLLIDRNGTVKLLDLGLARLEMLDEEGEGLTQSGSVMGTPDYMAPEQSSETKEADQRADIYSLGCTLFFLMGGKPPFKGATAFRKIQSHIDSPIPALPGDRSALDGIYRRMMAKSPGDRYQTMAEVVADLESFAGSFPAQENRSGRSKWSKGIIAAAALILIGTAAGIGWLADSGSKQIPTVDERGLPLKPPPTAGGAYFADSGQRLGSDWSLQAKLGDLDGDGDLDAVVANYKDGLERVWLNDGSANFTMGAEFDKGASTTGVDLGDLDHDGDLDVVLVERNGSGRVFLNQGNAVFQQIATSLFSVMSRSVTLADVNGDSHLDAVISSGGVGSVKPNSVWFGDGTGHFTDSGQELGKDASWQAALADLDGDGDLDIVFAAGDDKGDFQEAPNTIWFNDGRGFFEEGGEPFSPGLARGVALGDLDADGDLDAVVGHNVDGHSGIWLNDGNQRFSQLELDLGGMHEKAVLADFDADGDLDVVLPSFNANRIGEFGNARWLNDGDGNFGEALFFGEVSDNLAADAGDLDGDGDWDLFMPRNGGNEIWLNVSAPEVSEEDSPVEEPAQ